jgi:hypothetical protein
MKSFSFEFVFSNLSIKDILTTIKNSNEELNDLQRELLLTIEVEPTFVNNFEKKFN